MRWLKWLLIAVFALLLVGMAVAAFGYYRFQQAISGPGPTEMASAPAIVLIERGTGVAGIGGRLERAGVISDARLFRLATRYLEADTSLKAGEYAFAPGVSMIEAIEQMRKGDVILHPVTIIEGSTVAQAMRIIGASDVLTGDLPAEPPEGSLLPDTYAVTRGTKRSEVLKRMQTAQTDLLDDIWEGRADNLPFTTKEEAITLASVVEKETSVPAEVGLVAGVFVNRLRLGMRLQSDPTIIYGISKGERLTRTRNGVTVQRGLFRSEIDRPTPWNTYQVDGLPATPICNPGAASIRAVLNPEETEMLFFVADGTGGHVFARTNAEHVRNVAAWRRVERDLRAKAEGG